MNPSRPLHLTLAVYASDMRFRARQRLTERLRAQRRKPSSTSKQGHSEREPHLEYKDLTLALDHDWMPDEVLPLAAHFYLAPKYHPDKGIILGSETGTCLTLPSAYADFRKTVRLHEMSLEKLFLRATTILDIPKEEDEAISEAEVQQAIDKAGFSKGNAVLLRTGWGDHGFQKEGGSRYMLASPYLSVEAARLLASFMAKQESDLLLMDTALIGRPDKYLIREWGALFPRPGSWPSTEAQMYLN